MLSPSGIEVRDLAVHYADTIAVDGVSLSCAPGAITALLGPNGAGKTTTVDVITGLRTPTRGTVTVLGHTPTSPEVKPLVGVMPQIGGIYPSARPLPWLEYLARLYPSHADPRRLLDAVGIDPGTRTTARRMSGGEQQRVKLAAALLPNPRFLVLDEPTAGLDPLARRRLLEVLDDQRARGVGILLTTHQLPDVEELADHVVVLKAGQVLTQGSLADLTGAAEAFMFQGPESIDTDALQAHLGAPYVVERTAPGRYIVHGAPTPSAFAALTAWCAERNAFPQHLQPGRSTLEQILIDAARDSQ